MIRGSRGYVLLELSLTYIILTFAVIALVPVFIIGIRANKKAEEIQKAVALSQELLEEVRLRRWDANTPIPAEYTASPSNALGIELGETLTDKATFNDVDDFNGWAENNNIYDPINRLVPGFSEFSRDVTVAYVDDDLNPSAAPTDYKQITVCTETRKLKPVCIDAIVTNR